MKVFIAGATGVLGRRLVKGLWDRGHSVLGLVRDSRGEQIVQSLGGESRWASIFDPDELAHAAKGADIVIHAASSVPRKTRPTRGDWKMNSRIRTEGTRALTECAARIGATVYLQQSVLGVARPPNGSHFDEYSPVSPADPMSFSALDGENIALQAGGRHGFKVSVLRCGCLYGADSAHTRWLGERLKRGRIAVIGRGDAVWACLHLDDAARAFITAAEAGRIGIWHLLDDEPVTVAKFLGAFAERLHLPAPRRLPTWLARTLAGRHVVSAFTASTRTSNRRFRREFGWAPRYPSCQEGLDQVVAVWRSDKHGTDERER